MAEEHEEHFDYSPSELLQWWLKLSDSRNRINVQETHEDSVKPQMDTSCESKSITAIVTQCADCCGQGIIYTMPKIGMYATHENCTTCNGHGKLFTTEGQKQFNELMKKM